MIDEEVEVRVHRRGVGDVIRQSQRDNLRIVQPHVRRQPLVDTDVVEARVRPGVLPVLRVEDDLEHHLRVFVVEPPPRHGRRGGAVRLGRIRRRVSLPRVGLEVLDLPAVVILEHRIVLVAGAGEELAVCQHSRRSRDLVHPIPDGSGLRSCEELSRLRFGDVPRRAGPLRAWYGGRGVVAQHADGDLAVDVDVLHELHEVEVRVEVLQPHQRRVPGEVDPAVLVGQVQRVEAAVISLGDVAQRVPRPRPARADGVELVVEDEQVAWRRVPVVRLGLEHLVLAHLEEFRPVGLVHGDEGGGDAARAGEELPPADAQLLGDAVGELLDAVLHLLLLLRLRIGQVLAVRDHLGGDGRLQVVRLIGALETFELILAEPRILFSGTRDLLWHGVTPRLRDGAIRAASALAPDAALPIRRY